VIAMGEKPDFGGLARPAWRSRALIVLSTLALPATAFAVVGAGTLSTRAASYSSKPSCARSFLLCPELQDSRSAFGYYVGHNEPATLFYSSTPGAGNRQRYHVRIPRDPSGTFSQSKGYNVEIHSSFWFGMALCDTYSYPEQSSTCTPDSDTNITDPSTSSTAPGGAYEELQFYPPGWVAQPYARSCDATRWCVALNIWSLSQDPINGFTLNSTCADQLLGGVENANFAFLTLDGRPLGPPDPLNYDANTSGNPMLNGGADTLFLNPGDAVTVTFHDTAAGLAVAVHDVTSGKTGSMTASAANGFGHVRFAPIGTSCVVDPYSFHPMFSTSSPQTRVLWTAHSYNIAFTDEIGHFDFCSHITGGAVYGACDGSEGIPGDLEPADSDDTRCFDASVSLNYPATGCRDSNVPGFDGVSYHRYWPDGSNKRPTAVLFSSPHTGSRYSRTYPQFAFEVDLPNIEPACHESTGAGCVNPPVTDDGSPAAFFPYFSTATVSASSTACHWGFGSTLPNTINSFGGSSKEFGPLYKLASWTFGGHGTSRSLYFDFNSGQQNNTC
jgi:hypothetical protein